MSVWNINNLCILSALSTEMDYEDVQHLGIYSNDQVYGNIEVSAVCFTFINYFYAQNKNLMFFLLRLIGMKQYMPIRNSVEFTGRAAADMCHECYF